MIKRKLFYLDQLAKNFQRNVSKREFNLKIRKFQQVHQV